MKELNKKHNKLINQDGSLILPLCYKKQDIIDNERETIWASQKAIAEIFGVTKQAVSEHLMNIYSTRELDKSATVKKILTVQTEGSREIKRKIDYYNLDTIISVGYRVNSVKATAFRKWATSTLKEYLIKGFALDDERLKRGNQLFGKDYFNELLEIIREIRASERLFYQKITDLYMTANDYDTNSPITKDFLLLLVTLHCLEVLIYIKTVLHYL